MRIVKKLPLMRHKLIVQTAAGMAEAVYEEMLKDNDFHRRPSISRRAFIQKNQVLFLQDARHTLAAMLARNIAEELKESISDALIKDDALTRGRIAPDEPGLGQKPAPLVGSR